MGKCISWLEEHLRALFPKTPRGERMAGRVLVLCMFGFAGVVWLALRFLYWLPGPFGYLAESLLIWQLLAGKDLRKESMAVYRALKRGDVSAAREAVSMIVGRDTASLDEAGITRAAVETVAENTSDGIVAPLFYIALGGGALGCLYKCVNTMDSMVGYKNAQYLDFGRAAAKTDDLFNYLPSRITARLMILCCPRLGLDRDNAERIWARDRLKHDSPNSGQTEAVMAGALGVRLGGDASYFGQVHKKEYLGDDFRPVEVEDIRRANKLSFASSVLALGGAVVIRFVISLILKIIF